MNRRWIRIVAIAAGIVAVAVFVLSLVLDSMLTSKARDEAAKLSQQWGRPVEVGSVATKLVTGLGVRVSDVRIGPAQGEQLPLVQLGRAEVKVALLKALMSRGKNVEVRSAEISGLAVNLIRFPDGTTNLERFQEKLVEQQQPKAAEPANKPESDLSFLRVDHAELSEGRVALVEAGQTKGLAIDHLDVRVDDLRAGKPLEVVVKAAVLAEKENFNLRLKAAPLPKSLVPVPEQLALKIQPIDLAPLGPFAGKQVGLEGGKLDADFDMRLGGVVPGGTGQTKIAGAIHALGLRFAGAEGGKPLDVTLDANVLGDAAKGDVTIEKLLVGIGPAGIEGHGSARGVNTDHPQIEGLEIKSHDLDPARLAAYYPPLRKQLQGRIAGPIGITVKGSGGKDAQALELSIDLTSARLSVPQTLEKATGGLFTIVTHVRGAAAKNGPLRFDSKLDLSGVDLRPGESLNKAPGQPLDLAVAGTRDGDRISLDQLKAHVLADEVSGRASAEVKGASKKFDLDLHSPHLDLDRLLLSSSKPAKKKPPPDPKTFAGLDGHALVRIDALTMSKQTVTNVVADVLIHDDDVKLTRADLVAFGGTVSASGTEVRLAHQDEPFHLVTRLKDVELGNALAVVTPRKLLTGKFSGDADLRGAGADKEDLAKTLAGVVDGHIFDGAFHGKDLIGAVTGPLAKALPFGLGGKAPELGSTPLGHDLPFSVTIANGVAKLKRPITVTRPEAALSLDGGFKVDGALDLGGTIALAPQTIAAITGGKAKVQDSIPVKLRVVGPAWAPQIVDLDLRPAIATIVRDAGAGLIGKALGTGNVEKLAADKQKQAAEVEKQAQDRAAQEAKKAQDKIQNEAKDRLKGLFGK